MVFDGGDHLSQAPFAEMNSMSKKVCVFGIYDPGYTHNRALILGLQENGYEVVECNVNPKEFPGIAKYRELARLARTVRSESKFAFVLVLFPGHTVVWLARILFSGTPIVFDAFVSLFDSNVEDRKLYGRLSIKAFRDWLFDWSSCMIADRVLLDTDEHRKYFAKTFGVSMKKSLRVPVGSMEDIFSPRPESIPEEPFIVHFHGTYIPLQGIPYIIDAARLLRGMAQQQILFRIIGSGQESEKIKRDAQDLVDEGVVEFVGSVPLASLADSMAAAHVCLGIFGDTAKARRVIPNKVYEALAMGHPIITADTPAARELLSEETAVLVPPANAQAIAEGILALQADPERCRKLAAADAELFRSQLLPKRIAADMLRDLNLATIKATRSTP